MIRLQTLARILLIALGLYASIRLLGMLPGSFYGLFQAWGDGRFRGEALVMTLASLIILLLFIYLAIKLLILDSDRWAQRMVGNEPGPEEFPAFPWLTVAFRLVCVLAGIYYLVNVIWNLGSTITALSLYHFRKFLINGEHVGVVKYILSRNLKEIFCVPLCIYLLYGAPHFVRWQVKKTRELCQSAY